MAGRTFAHRMKPPKFKDLILFENDDYIVVNKPPFLSTLDERIGVAASLLRLAREYADDAQVGHRLDRDTSGALVIAKNPEAYRHVSMQFENREVRKVYHAVTWGAPPLEQFVVERNIETTKSGKARLAYKGKPAETRFTTLDTCMPSHALVQCEPVTGRMHQIRLHLAYVQTPIVGDHALRRRGFFPVHAQEEVQPQGRRNRAAFHQALCPPRQGAGVSRALMGY